jgi:hypothetical protein
MGASACRWRRDSGEQPFDSIWLMKKWRVLFTLDGVRLETIIYAPSQLRAIMLAKAQYPQATSINAIEIT